MAVRISPLLLLIAAGITGGLGDIFIYKWAVGHRTPHLLGSFAFWLLSTTAFGIYLRIDSQSLTGGVLLAFAMHSLCAIGCDYLHQDLKLSNVQICGAIMLVLAMVMLESHS